MVEAWSFQGLLGQAWGLLGKESPQYRILGASQEIRLVCVTEVSMGGVRESTHKNCCPVYVLVPCWGTWTQGL